MPPVGEVINLKKSQRFLTNYLRKRFVGSPKAEKVFAIVGLQ